MTKDGDGREASVPLIVIIATVFVDILLNLLNVMCTTNDQPQFQFISWTR